MKRLFSRCLCFLLFLTAVPRATGDSISETEFKAALLYNILLFVQWPEGARAADSPLRLCYPESDLPSAQLSRLADKTIRQRKLSIRPVKLAFDAAAQCDAVWVGADRPDFLESIVLFARKYPVLIVAEGRGAVEKGAAIGLYLEGGLARLAIGDRSTRHVGIDISARLQQLASRHRHD